MSITVAQASSNLSTRTLNLLQAFGLSGQSSEQFNTAIARSLISLGIKPGNINTPTDADLAKVTDSEIAEFLDVSHFYVLEQILDNAEDVTEREGLNEQRWNERYAELRKRINNLQDRLEKLYGFGSSLTATNLQYKWIQS